jgi:hypothetical protein
MFPSLFGSETKPVTQFISEIPDILDPTFDPRDAAGTLSENSIKMIAETNAIPATLTYLDGACKYFCHIYGDVLRFNPNAPFFCSLPDNFPPHNILLASGTWDGVLPQFGSFLVTQDNPAISCFGSTLLKQDCINKPDDFIYISANHNWANAYTVVVSESCGGGPFVPLMPIPPPIIPLLPDGFPRPPAPPRSQPPLLTAGVSVSVPSTDPPSVSFVLQTDGSYKVNSEIPEGVQGVQGVQGDKGDKGDKGDTGPPGDTLLTPKNITLPTIDPITGNPTFQLKEIYVVADTEGHDTSELVYSLFEMIYMMWLRLPAPQIVDQDRGLGFPEGEGLA